MKKGTLAVALVVVFALAMAGTAFASWDDSTYTTWAEASAVSGAGSSPHYGFLTTTKNCAVCHAVHNAKSGGQVLLRSSVSGSCDYCHVDLTVNLATQVYGSLAANYSTDIRGNHSGSFANAKCSSCHAVHSANTVGNGANILKNPADGYAATGEATPTASDSTTPTANDIARWCSGCHPYYYTTYNQVSHVMTGASGVYTGSARTFTGVVSAIASTNCQNCHNSTVAQGFPHYVPTNPRFLTDGATSSTNVNAVNNDGPCLRCHTNVGSMY